MSDDGSGVREGGAGGRCVREQQVCGMTKHVGEIAIGHFGEGTINNREDTTVRLCGGGGCTRGNRWAARCVPGHGNALVGGEGAWPLLPKQ